MEEVIDLMEYFSIIKKKWYIIAILCVICVAASSVYSFFIAKPVYQADRSQIHYRLQAKGFNTNQVVTYISIISLTCSIVSIILLLIK